jgi:hypothetical protein
MLALLVGGIYSVRRWNILWWHDVCTKFHDDQFSHLSSSTVNTATIREDVMLVLPIEGIYELCRWDGFVWYDKRTKFCEDWCWRSSNIKVSLKNLKFCNIGITDGWDL